MNGIIILEGPDACGKTVLQQCFKDNFNAVCMHLTYNKEVAPVMLQYQYEKMQEAIELSKESLVVIDRHWISEQIYSKVFRGGSPWPLMGLMMDAVLKQYNAMYIICLPVSLEVGLSRHKNNLDMTHPYSDEEYTELIIEYIYFYCQNMSDRTDVLKYSIEIEGANMPEFCNRVLMYLKVIQTWGNRYGNTRNYSR
jgi:thymidylate kinase